MLEAVHPPIRGGKFPCHWIAEPGTDFANARVIAEDIAIYLKGTRRGCPVHLAIGEVLVAASVVEYHSLAPEGTLHRRLRGIDPELHPEL